MVTTPGFNPFFAALEAKLSPLLKAHQRERVKAILAEQTRPSYANALRLLYYELADEDPGLASALAKLVVATVTGKEEDPEREYLRKQHRADVDALDKVYSSLSTGRYYGLKALGLWTQNEALGACGLPVEQLSSFGAFRTRPNLPRVQQALEAALRWVQGKAPPLLTLSGPPGCGKTHLLTAAVRELVQRSEFVRYWDERSLLDASRRAIGEKRVEEFKQEVSETPRLVLDDLGSSASNDYDRAVLDEIIDERWAARRYTLVATNLTSLQLPRRLASRLGDTKWGVQVSIAAPDGRQDRWYEG